MSDLNDALRQYARGNHLRFDDQGKLTSVDASEPAEPETSDQQPERFAEGSADAGVGNDHADTGSPRHRRSTGLNDLIRDARGY